MKKLGLFLCLLLVVALFGCGAGGDNSAMGNMGGMSGFENFDEGNNNEYLELVEKDFVNTSENNKVNVSLDSSTAAYGNLRKLIKNLYSIPADAVNIEQMLNYFPYSYKNETENQLTSFLELSACPWNAESHLLSVAVKAKEYTIENDRPNNFVFLIDTSGSMYSNDKLPLLIESFKFLIDNLKENDRVSIVTYASSDQVLLDGGYGHEKAKISAIMSDLEAYGSTAGSKGIQTAYELASKYYMPNGNNRVFLATDGDFNVGISSTSALKNFISEKRQTGIYLSLFGYGYGNLKSDIMDTLAQAGNGNYYYIDSLLEAQKVFGTELGGTLNTVAKDAKAQVEFNQDLVEKYRLIGYENKQLTDEEFEDSETDAGEIGAGHVTVCLIEVVLKDGAEGTGDLLKCVLRYKDALDNDMNKEVVTTCNAITTNPSNDFLFQASVVEFALVLRDSKYKGDASTTRVIERIESKELVSDDYRKEFLELVKIYHERHQD